MDNGLLQTLQSNLNDLDVVDTACDLISTFYISDNSDEIFSLQEKCLISFHEEFFERDSKIVLSIYEEHMRLHDEIASVDDILQEILELNLDVCRSAATTLFLGDDNFLSEAHHNAIASCKLIGVQPDESSELFAQEYAEAEHEVITAIASELFNEHSFTMSNDITELITSTLDANNCIYKPSRTYEARAYYDLYLEKKQNEVIPVVNDCQELLIPELSSFHDDETDIRFMRIGSGVSC